MPKAGSKKKAGKGASLARKNKQKKGSKKKKVDAFLKKEWYVIKVPTYMPTHKNSWRVGFSPANRRRAHKALRERMFTLNVADLHDDPHLNKHPQLSWKKFTFLTREVFGDKLLTQWNGMTITRDKRCSLIRKWRTMIETICDATTTDGYLLRIKVMGFTKRQMEQVKKNCYAKRTQIHQIRQKMKSIIGGHVSSNDLEGVVKRLMEGSIGKDIRQQCQLIFPVDNCVIEKVKVLKRPTKDAAKLMSIHDLKTGFDAFVEEEDEDEDDQENDEEEKEEEAAGQEV